MPVDVVDLARDLVSIKSVSRWSNVAVTDLSESTLRSLGFEVERLEYVDDNGERKASVIGKKGTGPGGLAFFSHTDTVPGDSWDTDPCAARIDGGRVVGLGSCDMKGPLAATIVAAALFDASKLERAVYVAATADEEVGGGGAKQVVRESRLFHGEKPRFGVVAEPTMMEPVYAHKGGASVIATARGRAAHTSTELGVSANFLIAPFLAEMAELAKLLKSDTSFHNPEFSPPSLGFNLVLNDGGTRPNVAAPKTVATVSFRPMPNDRSRDVQAMVEEAARRHGLEYTSRYVGPFYVPPDSEIVRAALEATGARAARTVPYGTDGLWIKDQLDLVVLGPGNIEQAHTVGEWIAIDQLERAVDSYQRLIRLTCT